MPHELTTANKILVAAADLDEERETFTAEDLIVRAWTQFPESFGLTGYRDRYPDSNRVLSKLMGSVGLCSRGWLEQISTKLYRMTPGGRKFAATLRDGKPSNDAPEPNNSAASTHAPLAKGPRPAMAAVAKSEPRPALAAAPAAASAHKPQRAVAEKPSVPPPTPIHSAVKSRANTAAAAAVAAPPPVKHTVPAVHAAAAPVKFEGGAVLARLVASVASQKFTRGGLVTFADACGFWSISPSVHASHLAPRLGEVELVLAQAEKVIQQTHAAIKVNDKIEINLTQVIGLQGLHKMLKQKYARELDAIRARAEA